MHLLAKHSGTLADEAEVIDLEQRPGKIAILTAADTEIAALAAVLDTESVDDVRLVPLNQLSHAMSVDLWLERTGQFAQLIIVRLLGSIPYWSYGVEQLVAVCGQKNIQLAILPGDLKPDPELEKISTLSPSHYAALLSYMQHGGAINYTRFLHYARFILTQQDPPKQAQAQPDCVRLEGEGRVTAFDMHTIAYLEPLNSYILVLFYRSALEAGNDAPVKMLIQQIEMRGEKVLALAITSLKSAATARLLSQVAEKWPPLIVLNLTAFSLGNDALIAPLDQVPVLQLLQSLRQKSKWDKDTQGLTARDLAMHVVLPELDGRITSHLVSHKADPIWHEKAQTKLTRYMPDKPGIERVVRHMDGWLKLVRTQNKDKKILISLANYPIKDGRLANGVGYDTPQSTVDILARLKAEGYGIGDIPADGTSLIKHLQKGPTNAHPERGNSAARLALAAYKRYFAELSQVVQQEIVERWGAPEDDLFVRGDEFVLSVVSFGNVAVMLQPARGYHIDIDANYHDPALVPPHAYLAMSFWAHHQFGVHALIHNGKHGSMEWLPGKAVALSKACYPDILWGQVPHLYPFIVNDPGEGSQAKRRTGAVVVDHLTPPLARAEIYGPLKDLEALVDEYYIASGLDPKRLAYLASRIMALIKVARLDEEAALDLNGSVKDQLNQVDAYICDLKEAQIRQGLHIFGTSPKGTQRLELLVALARVPRGTGEGENGSFIRALAQALELGADFDPLDCDFAQVWQGPRPALLAQVSDDVWRHYGDTVERLELLALKILAGEGKIDMNSYSTDLYKVLNYIEKNISLSLDSCGEAEFDGLLAGLNGRFVPPGSSGAPTRGRPDCLPTGKNFYSLDNRTLPTPSAYNLGKKSAKAMLIRHFQDHGTHLTHVGLSVWATSNMRTGGDDIAQALYLLGVKPVWDTASWRVTGYEIIPMAQLNRPRVDVTLRISGMFRDSFPQQISLFDAAVRAVIALDEAPRDNPFKTAMAGDVATLIAQGWAEHEARLHAGCRIFGARPGAYGAGLQALIDSSHWDTRDDLAHSFIEWGEYGYGKQHGKSLKDVFIQRLKSMQAVIHNQDNREHDLLDSDDYYQFEGGMAAAIEVVSGIRPTIYHNDHSKPENLKVRTLDEELARTVRSRVLNPKWIEAMMRHGYKGGFELAATLDYLFAFAATTDAVKSYQFDLVYEAFLDNEEVVAFLKEHNPQALKEMAGTFLESEARGFWQPRSNHAVLNLNTMAAKRIIGRAHKKELGA